jgi:transposase-like protein
MIEMGESGLSRMLWPVHLKPQEDELLSSWLTRLALAHGLRLKSLGWRVWPGRSVTQRDVDFWKDQAILETLAEKTHTPAARLFGATLASYEGWLAEELGYHAPWILARQLRVRPQQRFGLQYCPWCLVSDEEPYFRRHWRLAFVVLCPAHRVLLLDRCQKCGAAVSYERQSPKCLTYNEPWILTQCHQCNTDLREWAVDCYFNAVDAAELEFQTSLEVTLRRGWIQLPNNGAVYSHLFFSGLYHIISRLTDGQIGSRLQTALRQNYGINLPIDFSAGQKVLIERLDAVQRRGLLQAVNRLLQDWPDTFVEFCRANNLASHLLIRSKRPVPFWYWRVVREQLTKTARPISKEEVLSILNYLRKGGGKLSLQELNRFLSGHSIQRAQQAGLIKIKKGGYPGVCSYCHATEHQFKGGFSHSGIQLFRCGECHRRYPRPDYPSIKTRTRTWKRHPKTVRRKAIELYQAGNTFAQIGHLLSIPRPTVFHWCKA